MTDYLLPDYLSKIQLYLMGTCSIFTQPRLQYLQNNGTMLPFTAYMLKNLEVLMPHLSNPSVMTTFLPPLLPTTKKGTKYCVRLPFSNIKVETCYTESY